MVLKAEQERLQTLLREAIPMMCKNGVPYKTEFSIEALIGITVDQNEVFLVSIKETFQNEAAIKELEKAKEAELAKEAERQKELEAASRQSETGSPRSPRSPRARKRRRSRESIGKSSSADRTPSRDINESDYEEEDTKEKLKFATDLSFGDDSNSYMEDGANQNPNDSAYNEYEPPPKSRPYVDSKERLQQDDEEIVIIKEEPADALSDISFPPSAQGQFSNASQMPSQPQFSHSFGSLSQHNQSGQLPPPQMQQSPLQGQQVLVVTNNAPLVVTKVIPNSTPPLKVGPVTGNVPLVLTKVVPNSASLTPVTSNTAKLVWTQNMASVTKDTNTTKLIFQKGGSAPITVAPENNKPPRDTVNENNWKKYVRSVNDKTVACSLCGKENPRSTMQNLRFHILGVHFREFTRFCRYCNKGFRWETSVFKHEKVCAQRLGFTSAQADP